MDFRVSIYRSLLDYLRNKDYSFQMLSDFRENPVTKSIILRHDVDKLPQNALAFARIEQEMGIRGTYFFRIVKESFDARIIEEIAKLGHEIGYHYEDLSLAAQSMGHGAWSRGRRGKDEVTKRRRDEETVRLGDLETERFGENNRKLRTENRKPLFEKAIELFDRHLQQFREIYPVTSIAMHGSPLSRWDSRLLWKYYDYKDFGIKAEPYFDVNFEGMLYLTDTGRRWNGGGVSVRDKLVGSREYVVGRGGDFVTKRLRDLETKGLRDEETERFEEDNRKLRTENRKLFHDWKVKPIPGSLLNPTQKTLNLQNQYNFRHTRDIIRAAEKGELPDKIMITLHPQRWSDKTLPWIRELVMQNVKNVAKYFLIRLRD